MSDCTPKTHLDGGIAWLPIWVVIWTVIWAKNGRGKCIGKGVSDPPRYFTSGSRFRVVAVLVVF